MKCLKRISFLLLLCLVFILSGKSDAKANAENEKVMEDRKIYNEFLQNKEYKDFLKGKVLFHIIDINDDGRLELILTSAKDTVNSNAYFFMIENQKVCFMDKIPYSTEENLYYSPSKDKVIKSQSWSKEIYKINNNTFHYEGKYVWDVFSDLEDSYYKDDVEITMEEYFLNTTFEDASYIEFYKNNSKNRSKYLLQEVKLMVSNKILKQGKTFHIKLNQANDNMKFISSNEKVVKVDTDGKVTAVGAGTASITVRVGQENLQCNITVPDQVYKVGIVNISPAYSYYKAKYASNGNDFIITGKKITKEASNPIKLYMYNDNYERLRVGSELFHEKMQTYKDRYQRDWIPARIYLLNNQIIKITTLYYDSTLNY